jgi:hypothetical protein
LPPSRRPAQLAQVQASGPRTLSSDQSNQGTQIFAGGDATIVQVSLPSVADGVTTSASDNGLSAVARGNHAADSLAPDPLAPATGNVATRLAAGRGGVIAGADTLIASSQRNMGSAVQAVLTAPRISLDASLVTGGRLGVTANSQEADALGNDGTSTLMLTDGTGGGAGIVTLQRGDASSPVAARALGTIGMTAQQVSTSDLSLTGNLVRALGDGNLLDNALTVSNVGAVAPASGGIAAIVPDAGGGDPVVNAAYAVLSSQETGATVKARTGDVTSAPSFGVTVAGGLDSSSVDNDGNRVVAASRGNQAANALDLEGDAITPGTGGEGGPVGALANVTGVQKIDNSDVLGLSLGGTVTHVLGSVTGSRLSASQNSLDTEAVGNLATGNLLTVKADSIDMSGGDPLAGGAGAMSVVSGDGTASVAAPVGVLNVQDFGNGLVRATQQGGAVQLIADRGVVQSSLRVDGNDATGAATGDSAVNGLSLDATSLRTAASLGNL